MRLKLLAYAQLALAMVIVGSSVVVAKLATSSLPVMLASGIRFSIASPVLLLLLWWREGPIALPDREDWGGLFWQALTGVFLFSVCLLYGLRYTGALEAGLITGTLPAVTTMLAVLLLHERPTRWQLGGIVCAVIGTVLLNTEGASSPDQAAASTPVGILLVIGAVFCEGLFAVLGKRTRAHFSALKVATAMSVLGCLLFLPFALWDALSFDWSGVRGVDGLAVVYLALPVTVGAFWLFYAGLSKVTASAAGTLMAFMPLSAVAFSSLVLGEPIQPVHQLAGACVLMGIVLAALPTRRLPNP